jgi:hypothetical protein
VCESRGGIEPPAAPSGGLQAITVDNGGEFVSRATNA